MFKCPGCAADTLDIVDGIELLPDAYSDELTLQAVQCLSCPFRGVAVYEESRHGSSESWHHNGYQSSEADWATLVETINRCPSRRNKNCTCATHVALGKVDQSKMTFTMQQASKRAGEDRMAAFRAGDVYIDLPFENAKFRYEHASQTCFRRFYGQAEVQIPRESALYNDAISAGTFITREQYDQD